MNCKEFRDNLERYLEDTIEGDLRLPFRRHLRECPSCRERALSQDPTMLFALAETTTEAPARVEACVTAVTAQIRQDRLARRIRGRGTPWLAAAAAVVLAIGGTAAWRLAPGGIEKIQPNAANLEAVGASQTAPPTVEVEMVGEDVRVYQFAAEDDEDTAVYFIVNPALEL